MDKSVGIGLKGKVSLNSNLIPTKTTFELDEIRLQVNRTEQDTTITIGGKLTINTNITLNVEVRYDSATKGWRFSGMITAPSMEENTQPNNPSLLSLYTLIPSLNGSKIIPNISINEAMIVYDTAQKTIQISGKTQWTFNSEIPILGGTTQNVSINLEHTFGDASSTSFSLGWTYTPEPEQPNGRKYAASFHHDQTGWNMQFDLDCGKDTLNIGNIINELFKGQNFKADSIPGMNLLNDILQVSTFSLTYNKIKGNGDAQFAFAFTRPLGEGILLFEYDHQPGSTLIASWVPNQEGLTIGLNDLKDWLTKETNGISFFSDLETTFSTSLFANIGSDIYSKLKDKLTFNQLGLTTVKNGDIETINLSASPVNDFSSCNFMYEKGSGGAISLKFNNGISLETLLSYLPSELSAITKGIDKQINFTPTSLWLSTLTDTSTGGQQFSQVSLQPGFVINPVTNPATNTGLSIPPTLTKMHFE